MNIQEERDYFIVKEMLQGISLTVSLQATLLPFKNLIISDGLVSVKLVRFGRSIASDFKDVFMDAKRRVP